MCEKANFEEKWEELGREREQLCGRAELQPVRSSETKLELNSTQLKE